VRAATAETAPIFGKIRAPLKLRMPKKIVPIEVDENIVVEVNEEVVPLVRNENNAFFTFGGNLYI
jgi:hypothetical protein